MATRKANNKARRVLYDQDHYGEEPILTKDSKSIDIISAYNWYGHFYVADDAKKFVLDYFKKDKKKKAQIEKISAFELYNIGWNCRILSNGGVLPEDIEKKVFSKLDSLISIVVENQKKEKEAEQESESKASVVSIQERVENYAKILIADLESHIDDFIMGRKSDFIATEWFSKMNVKPQVAKHIQSYYEPLYQELVDAYAKKNDDLVDAYSYLKKRQLKKYMEFIKSLLAGADNQKTVVKKTRKPRKKKEKPASVLVSKMKYQKTEESLNLTSAAPVGIIGAQQVWTYNTKNRVLTVFNALSPAGLSVKGSTLIGYDEATSKGKKLRKPDVTIPQVLSGGKIVLKKLLGSLSTKEASVSGRINNQTIVVRILK